MWQAPAGKDVFQEKSDRVIRQAYDTAITENEQYDNVANGLKL